MEDQQRAELFLPAGGLLRVARRRRDNAMHDCSRRAHIWRVDQPQPMENQEIVLFAVTGGGFAVV